MQLLGVVFAIVAWFLALFSIWTALRGQLHLCLAVFRMVEMSVEEWCAGWRVLSQETQISLCWLPRGVQSLWTDNLGNTASAGRNVTLLRLCFALVGRRSEKETWPSVVLGGGEGRKEDCRAFLVCYPDNCLQKTDETLLNRCYRDSLLKPFRVEIPL